MTSVCPAGHSSTADDYCDVCGMPIEAPATSGPPVPVTPPDTPAQAGTSQACPNCETPNAIDALFCEACGYDFTTGTMPRPLDPPDPMPGGAAAPGGAVATAPEEDQPAQPTGGGEVALAAPPVPPGEAPAASSFDWVAEVWIDPAWYAAQESPDPLPSAGLPEVVPLRGPSVLVGRVSRSRNIHPEVDCDNDSGVSRRQCQLSTDGTRWWVTDLESANGTFVGPSTGELPSDPIPVGPKRELAPDERIYVGAWTRIVVRPSTDDERATLG